MLCPHSTDMSTWWNYKALLVIVKLPLIYNPVSQLLAFKQKGIKCTSMDKNNVFLKLNKLKSISNVAVIKSVTQVWLWNTKDNHTTT